MTLAFDVKMSEEIRRSAARQLSSAAAAEIPTPSRSVAQQAS